MKKICLLITLACCSAFAFSQTLFSFGNTSVDKDEFVRAYNKNKTPVTDKEKSLKEYLDLYINFKLKVKAARDLRLDTLPQLKSDLVSFRNQIEESYLNNENALNGLIEEAFTRSQKDLHVLHFFIPLTPTAKPEDTLAAYRALNEVRGLLQSENNNYEKVSKTLTEKYSGLKTGDLGFVTAFSLPYEYENIVFGLGVGETSRPYRSLKGLHVFNIAGDRKAAGKWKIAQILLSFPPGEQSQQTSVRTHHPPSRRVFFARTVKNTCISSYLAI